MSSNLAKALSIAIRTGKITLGYKKTLETLRSGKAKLVVVAGSIPEEFKVKLEALARLTGTPILNSGVSSLDLGAACGKPFTVSALAVRDPGDSDILSFVKPGRKKRGKS